MKKLLLSISLFILFPLTIKAADIKSTEIIGMNEKSVGEELELSFQVSFSGLNKGYEQTLGVWFVGFELIYDDTVFTITDISSSDFKSMVYKEGESRYVLGQVIEDSSSNNCGYGLLYCSDYLVTIKFFIKETDTTSATIKMGEVEAALLDITDIYKTYTVDDAIEITKISNKSHTVKINKESQIIVEEPKNIVSETKPKENTIKSTETIENKVNIETLGYKSANCYLSNLKIENYEINFEKNTTNYTINVDENVNNLNIEAIVEDSRSTYNIIGADDLKANNYKVNIEVTAEDDTKKVYIINVQTNNQINDSSQVLYKAEDEPKKKIDKSVFKIIGIVLGIIFLITIVSIIISKLRNRKIDKWLDEI